MPRTTYELVNEVITVGTDDFGKPISLSIFIETAAALVNRVENCAIARGTPLTEEELRILETWIAAHLYAHRDPQYISKTTERASATFQVGQLGKNLESTMWGQTALSLDPSGCLQTLAQSSIRVGLTWLGKPKSQQIDYADRS